MSVSRIYTQSKNRVLVGYKNQDGTGLGDDLLRCWEQNYVEQQTHLCTRTNTIVYKNKHILTKTHLCRRTNTHLFTRTNTYLCTRTNTHLCTTTNIHLCTSANTHSCGRTIAYQILLHKSLFFHTSVCSST